MLSGLLLVQPPIPVLKDALRQVIVVVEQAWFEYNPELFNALICSLSLHGKEQS